MQESSTPAQPTPDRKEVVVMFTDIVDFTAYCDAHNEEESLALVTRHENLVGPIISAMAARSSKRSAMP